MVDVRTQQSVATEQTPRQKAKAARLELVKANRTIPPIKVYAGSEEVHAIMRHPSGLGFRGAFGTATEWPHDSFTHRRLADGSIGIAAAKPRSVDPTLGVREAAYANRPKPEDIPPAVPLSVSERAKSQQQQSAPAPRPPAPAPKPAA